MITFNTPIEFIRKNDKFIITTHEMPDGDGIGSEIAMAKAASEFGGGGHKTAAGFRSYQSLANIKKDIIEYLIRKLNES